MELLRNESEYFVTFKPNLQNIWILNVAANFLEDIDNEINFFVTSHNLKF